MRVTVYGTGSMGRRLVRALAPHHDLRWVGRTVEGTRHETEQLGWTKMVQPVDHAGGLDADVIILALWHRDMLRFARDHQRALRGRVVVDIANPFTEDFESFFTPHGTSAAEELQKAMPDARVVGAFKNTYAAVFDHPHFQEGYSDVLVTGDDADAKARVMSMLAALPFRVLDAGALSNNRTIERMTLLSREVGRRHGFSGRLAYRMLGQDT